jgi:predicted DNA-binding transcriptional regulator YafY
MSRADRLFQIVDLLRRRRFMTAAQLAEHFEVSQRTIYRDVLELSASGIPVLGEAGVGYRLDPNYKLPPLMFNNDEIEALVIGMRMVESWGDDELRLSAGTIIDKVNAVISQGGRQQLKDTALFSLSFGKGKAASRHLGSLRRAVNERRKVVIRYSNAEGAVSTRTIRSLGLFFWGKSWTVAAYCELRRSFRNFRVDRVEGIEVSGETFELISPCTLDDYIEAMQARSDD